MFTKREWIIFFAGAQSFHAISHIILSFTRSLPITFFGIAWTQPLNVIAIIINVILALLLLL